MNSENQIEFLIVDTSAFIKNVQLQNIGQNIITEEAVVDEIKNKRQLRRLAVLPYDLKVQNVFDENIKFVTDFSKKTGDYTSLSSTDIKVIALTYQLEKEKVGIDHLRTTPIVSQTVDIRSRSSTDGAPLVGFYVPRTKENSQESDTWRENHYKELIEEYTNFKKEEEHLSEGGESSDYESAISDTEFEECREKLVQLTCEPSANETTEEILVPVDQPTDEYETEESDDEDEDEDTWITPSNIKKMTKNMDSNVIEDKSAKVACLTMDFAMQNVLMQIGLKVASLDGKIIKRMRTYIFRCYGCFKTTSIMTSVFCPNCGNKTLKKVAVSIDEEGKQQIHINFKKPISARGKRFSLPTPKGGKHANNPILCADQPLPRQRPSRLARSKTEAFDDDYIAGHSPFVQRDINSKSAILGIRPDSTIKYWMKRNPNVSKQRRK